MAKRLLFNLRLSTNIESTYSGYQVLVGTVDDSTTSTTRLVDGCICQARGTDYLNRFGVYHHTWHARPRCLKGAYIDRINCYVSNAGTSHGSPGRGCAGRTPMLLAGAARP